MSTTTATAASLPTSVADVVNSVKSARAAKKALLIRSGAPYGRKQNTAMTNFDADTTSYINLSELNTVTVPEAKPVVGAASAPLRRLAAVATASTDATNLTAAAPRVHFTVGAGATIDDVYTKALRHPKLASAAILPLSLKKEKSVGSAITHLLAKEKNGSPTFLGRSLGNVSQYISNVSIIDHETGETFDMKGGDIRENYNTDKHVITSVELEAPSADSYRTASLALPYNHQLAEFILQQLTVVSKDARFSKIDVSVEVFCGPFMMNFIRINAAGHVAAVSANGVDDESLLTTAVNALLPPQLHMTEAQLLEKAKAALPNPDDLAAAKSKITNLRSVLSPATNVGREAVSDVYGEDVLEPSYDSTVGVRYDKTIIDSTNANANISQFLDDFEKDPAQRFGLRALATTNGTVQVKTRSEKQLLDEMPIDEDGYFVYGRTVTNGWLEVATSGNRIPDFKGKTFSKQDRFYKDAIQQYALSSFEAEMCPFIVAYPQDITDIQTAITFAKANNKYITARSGGHQYCGKSSGGQDTIVISLDTDEFAKARQLSGAESNFVEVGPGMKLIDLTRIFCDKKVRLTVPHGECPFVCIGGHAQTGGYGHMTRSFGLCLDRVDQFDIVLSDGTLRTIVRPRDAVEPESEDNVEMSVPNQTYRPTTKKDNRDLFRCVLAGNAGSFGIVTRYIFDGIRSSDYPNSEVYARAVFYSDVTFSAILKNYVAVVTKKILEGKDDEYAGKGVDFMMTVAPRHKLFMKLKMLVAEGVSIGDRAEPFAPFDDIISNNQTWWGDFKEWGLDHTEFAKVNGPCELSDAARRFVRLPGKSTTDDGREFPEAYKKRINCTFSALNTTFIDGFVAHVSRVLDSNINLVFQMSLGGGAYKSRGKETCNGLPVTGIPHRDYTFCFVFDLFYPDGEEAAAEAFQASMGKLVKEHYNNQDNNRDARVFWGSFEDKVAGTDMKTEAVRKAYYDTPTQYADMQEVKERFDGCDLYHTSLTVQLPGTSQTTLSSKAGDVKEGAGCFCN